MQDNYKQNIKIKVGQKINLFSFMELLNTNGYERISEIEYPGQYSVSGDTLIIQTSNNNKKVRIDLFGDVIENLYLLKDKIDSTNSFPRVEKEQTQNIEIQPNLLIFEDGELIKPNKYVVHIDHGIGIFKCLGMKQVNSEFKQYIFIEYFNNSFLYLPIGLKSKISSYIGVGQRKPKLNKLGSSTWQKTKQKAYESVIALTRELLLIYAKRELIERKPYKIDQQWDKEISNSFGFTETPDQEKALKEVYSDLRKKEPLDRLICGDVGFGKTEIAIRAAVQAMANGHQAVLMCPTTILAEQHFANFSARMKKLPVRIAKLSRFYNKKKQFEVLKGLKEGSIDFIVSTRLCK